MSDAELILTLKNATFMKDPNDNSKYIFGPIGSIEQIGGSFKNDKNETVDFGDNIATTLTKDSLTTRINEKMAPKKAPEPVVDQKIAEKAALEKAVEDAKAEKKKKTDTDSTADTAPEDQAIAAAEDALTKFNNANPSKETGGARKSRKSRKTKRTKKGGKKRRSTRRSR